MDMEARNSAFDRIEAQYPEADAVRCGMIGSYEFTYMFDNTEKASLGLPKNFF